MTSKRANRADALLPTENTSGLPDWEWRKLREAVRRRLENALVDRDAVKVEWVTREVEAPRPPKRYGKWHKKKRKGYGGNLVMRDFSESYGRERGDRR